MIRTIALVLSAVGLVATVVATPASAQTITVPDRRGDADAAIDFTRARITNGAKVVRVRVIVPRFQRAGVEGLAVMVQRQVKGRPVYAVSRARRANGWTRPFMEHAEGGVVRCQGDRVAFRRNGFEVRIPQRCLGGNSAKIRAAVMTVGRTSETSWDDTDWTWLDFSNRTGGWVRYR